MYGTGRYWSLGGIYLGAQHDPNINKYVEMIMYLPKWILHSEKKV